MKNFLYKPNKLKYIQVLDQEMKRVINDEEPKRREEFVVETVSLQHVVADGIAEIELKRKKYEKAKEFYNKILSISKDNYMQRHC